MHMLFSATFWVNYNGKRASFKTCVLSENIGGHRSIWHWYCKLVCCSSNSAKFCSDQRLFVTLCFLAYRSAVLDLTRSPFQCRTLIPTAWPMGYHGKVHLSSSWWLTRGTKNHDIPPVALVMLLPFQILWMSGLTLSGTETVGVLGEVSLICFNHFLLEFQGVIAQSYILKLGKLKGHLAWRDPGTPRTGYFARAIGDFKQAPSLISWPYLESLNT